MTATYVRTFSTEGTGFYKVGLAVDPTDGTLVVADQSGGFMRWNADGTEMLDQVALSGVGMGVDGVWGVTVDDNGKVWACDYAGGSGTYPRVYRMAADFTAEAAYLTVAAFGSEIEGPTDIHAAGGKIYVVSNYHTSAGPTYKQGLVRLSGAGAYEATIGTNATLSGSPLAFPEPQVDGEFAYPVGVTSDSAGNLYVSDVHKPYRSIQKFSAAGAHLLTFGGPGTGDGQFSTSEFAITGWTYDGMKLAADEQDRIYACDLYGARVNVYDTSGTPLFSFSNDDTPDSSMFQPLAVACGPGGKVYVADYYNGYVTLWQVDSAPDFQIRGISVVVCGDTDC